jgi:hypothetical protein
MTVLFANELQSWCILALFVLLVADTAFFTQLHLAVIRSDKTASGYELGQKYGVRQILMMHRALSERNWMRRLFYVSSGITLAALIPYTVLSANNLMHNNLLHLISRGR